MIFYFFFSLIFLVGTVCAESEEKEEKPIKAGNFSLRGSQQPSPLISFGQNIIDQGEVQFSITADEFKRKKGYLIDVLPNIVYGITDKASILLNLPVAIRYKEQQNRARGLEDFALQFEYAFYSEAESYYSNQATVVANIAYPSGSIHKNPQTGAGSPSFFLGTTFSHMTIDWFYFSSFGTVLTTSHHHNKLGEQYYYQGGFGRNIATPPGLIYAWMVEFNGFYAEKNILKGRRDHNSGGNVIYITPSIWISSNNVIFQLGAGGVLTQHLYGNQSHFTYQIVSNLGWSF